MEELLLDSFEINGFRAFDRLRVEKLGRVNLIGGKNSVGKSSFLEALWMYAVRGNPNELFQMLKLRNEANDRARRSLNETEDAQFLLTSLRFVFNGRSELQEFPVLCTIGSSSDSNQLLQISIQRFYRITSEDGSFRISLIPEETEEVGEVSEVAYVVRLGDRNLLIRPVHLLTSRAYSSSARLPLQIPCIYAPSNGLEQNALNHFWDLTALTDLEEDVLNALRIIAPDIERINLIASREGALRSGDRVPMVKLKGEREPIPLRSLGEGVNRILGIVLALVNSKSGFLLIDEIESGLHYSVQLNLWKVIFSVARRLNIQVFATTHSWDCIEAFQAAAQEDEASEGMLIRLERKDGAIVPTLFDERRLGIATREQIEVR